MGQTVLDALNCDATVCSGGYGMQGGGNGGHFTFEDNTFTQSGGGGQFPARGHSVTDFTTGETVYSGGNPDTGGGHTVCDANGNCQTTGKP